MKVRCDRCNKVMDNHMFGEHECMAILRKMPVIDGESFEDYKKRAEKYLREG